MGRRIRRYGYDRTSVERLEQATGLSVGSLYHAYGNKAGLRRTALEHYLTGFVTALRPSGSSCCAGWS